MTINRRGFLSRLAGLTAAMVVLDPEKLLWVPGKKVISIPGETVMTTWEPESLGKWITEESMKLLRNNLILSNKINQQYTNTNSRNYKMGDLVVIYKPAQIVSLDNQRTVDWNMREIRDMCTNLDECRDKVVVPTVAALSVKMCNDEYDKIVFGDLPLPGNGVDEAIRSEGDSVSVRGLTRYDPMRDEFRLRLDVLYGGIK